ncbi:hypothetical protein ONS96_005745 [Cadophora gregata f. sp. sojae]|nr:hypothetical protein ONS96_005745 [Cadophora gregata f. sp. sojae]
MSVSAERVSSPKKVRDLTKRSNSLVINLKSSPKKLFDVDKSKEPKEILRWFGPVDPALKHKGFREAHQDGTGYWIFETPEYLRWTNARNSALWIHGVAGAGKTILASLVIETLSLSKPSGLAYFYNLYNDPDSQNPVYILGSLVTQLCQQNAHAFRDAIEFYKSYNTPGEVLKKPTVIQLGILVQRLSLHFDVVSVVVDGLDEVGALPDRSELMHVISTLHQGTSNIRTIVFSRDKTDIAYHLSNFNQTFVEARPSDLRLYVAANIHKLHLNDDGLKTEVLEAVVDHSDGIFFWTICQIQLLQNLPSTGSISSIENELKSLPGGLPATYCRLFEKINAEYSVQTQYFVQRALNWLVWGPPGIQMDEFVHMVCMHDDIQDLYPEDVPNPDSILKWLGCLVRMTRGSFELAHVSIREFLVSSQTCPAVQKYLMPETERFGPALACFSYLALRSVTQTPFDLFDVAAREAFSKRFPFYHHAATRVIEHAASYDPQTERPHFQRLFNDSAPQSLYFWIQYVAHFRLGGINHADSKGWTISERFGNASHRTSPLHVACELRLFRTVSRLLFEGANPDLQFARYPSPLHLVVDPTSNDSLCYNENAHLYPTFKHPVDSRTLKIITCLLDAKADVNLTSRYADSRMIGRRSKHHSCCSPLYVAIWYRLPEVCQILLDYGALLIGDLPALRKLAANFELDHTEDDGETWVAIFDRSLRQATYEPGVQAILKALKVKATPNRLDNPSWQEYCGPGKVTDTSNPAEALQETDKGLLQAIKRRDLDLAAYYMAKGPALSTKDAKYLNALLVAVQNEDKLDRLRYLRASRGESPEGSMVERASQYELMGNLGYANFFQSMWNQGRMTKTIEKADTDRPATNRGGNAAHQAMANGDLATLEELESQGVDIDAEDCVGERPIHIAIHQQFDTGVDFILQRKSLVDTINRASDHCGTPLYCAAKEGNIDIAEKLICAGAFVNAVVLPGNVLGPALYVACAEGHARLVRVLLSHGADAGVRTSRYGSAMEVAKAFEQREVIEVLESFGRCDVIYRELGITSQVSDKEDRDI